MLDIETTGSGPEDFITEIGAARVRGGELLGTFQTLINPGVSIPPTITLLTGISDLTVVDAPRIESVLGSLVDFIGHCVVVGHNVSFDLRYINAALTRDERPTLANRVVDTLPLARRLVRDEVPNCKLSTLARSFRFAVQPTHRALDDALATVELLHVLVDRAGRIGVKGLDDLCALTTMSGSRSAEKLKLTENLPRSGGIYLFRNAIGEVIYVGKAANLRSRVRSYFASDTRRKVPAMLREVQRIDHKRCASALESAILEIRLIHHCQPRFNVEANRWQRSVYVKLTNEALPRLLITREPKADGATYLGPVSSRQHAQELIDAIHGAVPLRRCARQRRSSQCIPSQLGVAMCPCAGPVDPVAYRQVVAAANAALTGADTQVYDMLRAKMIRLAAEQRFEEAASLRDRSDALLRMVNRQRTLDELRAVENLTVTTATGDSFGFRRGLLATHHAPATHTTAPQRLFDQPRAIEALPELPHLPSEGPLQRDLLDELTAIARWIDTQRSSATIVAEQTSRSA